MKKEKVEIITTLKKVEPLGDIDTTVMLRQSLRAYIE
jgi:hypothetical protein